MLEQLDILEIVATCIAALGCLTGIISLVKVNSLKSLDLRILRNKILSTIEVLLEDVKNLASNANNSKIMRFNAQGLLKSGSMEKWEIEIKKFDNDINIISENATQLKQRKFCNYRLERDINDLQLLEEKLKSIQRSLEKSIDEDDSARKMMREEKHAYYNRN